MASETITLHLPTMHCAGCMSTARRELEKVGAMIEESDIKTKRIAASIDTDQLTREDLEAALEAVGFPPSRD